MTSKLKVNLINDGGDNNIITSDGSGVITSSKFKIGQVINSSNSTNQVITATSYTDINSGGSLWETSITPSSTSSKILVTGCVICNSYYNGSNNNRSAMKVLHKIGSGSYSDTKIFNEVIGVYDYGNSGIWQASNTPISTLLSPNTTDAVTFKFQAKAMASGVTFVINTSSNTSEITLMEVFA